MMETLIGVIIGGGLTLTANYLTRKANINTAAIEIRLGKAQEAYTLCNKMKEYLHVENSDENKVEYIKEFNNWYYNNNLYLEPLAREKIIQAQQYLYNYNDIRMNFYKKKKTGNKIEKNKSYKELKDAFNSITKLPMYIEEGINKYYPMDICIRIKNVIRRMKSKAPETTSHSRSG